MSNLNDIATRHGRDRWKDAAFICAAVLLTVLSIGSVTSKAVGKPAEADVRSHVTVIESDLEIQR